jgi:hypothetical protein
MIAFIGAEVLAVVSFPQLDGWQLISAKSAGSVVRLCILRS